VQGTSHRFPFSVQELKAQEMAKQALLQRELKREKLAPSSLKNTQNSRQSSNDFKRTDDERALARLELQKLPRNANPTRQRNRCGSRVVRVARSVNSVWPAPRSANWPSQVISPVSPRPAGKH
jgi:hypothetical protein